MNHIFRTENGSMLFYRLSLTNISERCVAGAGFVLSALGKVDRFHRGKLPDHRDLEFLGSGQEWLGLRYRRKGRALVTLYPQRESFIAQVVLGKGQAERVSSLKLGKQVRMILNESPQLRDGRWLWIPVLNQVDFDDVQKLLLVKMQPPSGASMKAINTSR